MNIQIESHCVSADIVVFFCMVDGFECEVAIALPGSVNPHLIQGLTLKCFQPCFVTRLMTAIAAYCGKHLPQYKELAWRVHDKSLLRELGIEV